MENKKISKIYDNCEVCGLPIITCICNTIKKVKTKAKFIILSNERELYRNTNTANLLKLVNPDSTEIIIWRRGESSETISEYINNDIYKVYLVFPDINEELKSRKVEYSLSKHIPIFIIVDGTWKEAWKIVRKSSYLKELPIISLQTDKVSKFTLRRGQEEGNLCTIETAIELLKINEEVLNSDKINYDFDLFLESYKAGASGHKLKNKKI